MLKNILKIFLISTLVYILIVAITPIGKILFLSYFSTDDVFFSYLHENSKKNLIPKDLIKIDIIYLLLKNELFDSFEDYNKTIEIDKLKKNEKVVLLNYLGFYFYKKNELEKSKESLVKACKIQPNNWVLILNLNFILNLLEQKNQKDEKSNNESSIFDIVNLQDSNNIQNAVNQMIKSKIEKNKENKDDRYW